MGGSAVRSREKGNREQSKPRWTPTPAIAGEVPTDPGPSKPATSGVLPWPASWTNIFSKDDWISGELNFYGPLENCLDAEACIPVVTARPGGRNDLVFDKTFERISALYD